MNWQPLPLPARKRLLQAEPPARLKLFCSSKTPDSKASAKSPSEFCVLHALIQRREERTERRCPHEAVEIKELGVRRRRMREGMRAKNERRNRRGAERRYFRGSNG